MATAWNWDGDELTKEMNFSAKLELPSTKKGLRSGEEEEELEEGEGEDMALVEEKEKDRVQVEMWGGVNAVQAGERRGRRRREDLSRSALRIK